MLLILLLTLFPLSASAQFAINEQNLPWFGSSAVYHRAYDVAVLSNGLPGAGQVWNFPALSYDTQDQWQVTDPSAMFLADSFPYATRCEVTSFDGQGFVANFNLIGTGQYLEIGYASVFQDTFVAHFDPFGVIMPLPAYFGMAAWSRVTQYVDETFPGNAWTFRDSSVHEIDGWGTLEGEFGDFEVLRLKSKYWTIISEEGQQPDTVTSVSYSWLDNHGVTMLTTSTAGLDTDFTSGNVAVAEVIQISNADVYSGIGTDIALHQNSPNPFNSLTDIMFDLQTSSKVELRVYDLLGREVATLIDGLRNKGSHQVIWDGKNVAGLSVASGVYVYQIKTPNFTDAKKMMLIR